jgi:tetratricopeptide (TPR) repeat protein
MAGYTFIVPPSKWILAGLLLISPVQWAQQEAKQQAPAEEDESFTAKEYSFNPLQAQKELSVGDFYFKKKNYRAAAARYLEATRWNENSAEAYLKLGEALEKYKGLSAAREAYEKYLKLEPNGKASKGVQKKLQRAS